MAYEVRWYPVTVPHGTAIATPQTSVLAMPPRVIRRVNLLFPPGPFGQVGIQLAIAGVQVIPYGSGQWIIGDDHLFPFDVAGLPTSGAWQLIAYNVGAYDHTVYVGLEMDPPQLAGGAAGVAIPQPLRVGP